MTEEQPQYLEIGPEHLSTAALQGIIEAFVLQEGTEYGEREYVLSDKVAAVRAQLGRGEVVILYDPESRECFLTPRGGARGKRRP